LEERLGNRQRQQPSVSYYYCWDQADAGEVKRLKLYVKVRKLVRCRQMITERWPAAAIVAFLQE
jgi:hypothetical protein